MNAVLLILSWLALATTQILAGGRHPALYLPGYGLLALAALLSACPGRRAPVGRTTLECLAVSALFFAYIAGRAIFSPEEYLARHDLHLALGAAALYLIVTLHLTSSRLRLLFVAGLLVLGLANTTIGAIQFSQGQNYMVWDFLARPNYGFRASGFYGYPNHLASYLQITVFLGLAAACWSRWPIWGKICAGYAALVCLGGLLLTGSRGGYISCLVGLLVFGLLSLLRVGRLTSSRTGLIVAGMLLFLTLGAGAYYLTTRSFVLNSRAESTLQVDGTRMALWKAAGQQFKLQPVTGTGSGTYLYYGRQFRSAEITRDPIHTHNEYLQLLAEYGILGLIAALIFLESHLRSGWKFFSRSIARLESSASVGSHSVALTIGALSATVACLVHAFLEFNLHMPANMLVMAFVLGLLANPGAESSPATASDRVLPFPLWLRLVPPMVGLWIALRALPTWPAEYYRERARAVAADWQYLGSPEMAGSLGDLARQGLTWDGKNPELYFYEGESFMALAGQASDPATSKDFFEKSATSYARALELAPQDVRLVLCLAWSLDKSERFSESEPIYQQALQLDPRSADARYAYALHLELQGRIIEAGAQYRLALDYGGLSAAHTALERLAQEAKNQSAGEAGTSKPHQP